MRYEVTIVATNWVLIDADSEEGQGRRRARCVRDSRWCGLRGDQCVS